MPDTKIPNHGDVVKIIPKKMNKTGAMEFTIKKLLDAGFTDRGKIYDWVIDELGVPRPSVRRAARNVRLEFERKINVLQFDTIVGKHEQKLS